MCMPPICGKSFSFGEEWIGPTFCHDIAPSYCMMSVDVSYVAPQAHGIINVALHREYSLGIVFIFFQGRKDLYHV
jgi:hypothetical protein